MIFSRRRAALFLLIVLFALAALLYPEFVYRGLAPAEIGPNPF
jgi:hypothetical protein